MADAPWPGHDGYLEQFGGDKIPADSKDHMEFAAKMKAKAWNRPAEAEGRARLAAMSDSERMQLMMKVMLEEAQLNKGLTKEQKERRIKMEKIGWEQEDRAKLGLCRWYDCEKPEGTTLFACACHAPDIRYCSPECQKEDWKLQHKKLCSTRKGKAAQK